MVEVEAVLRESCVESVYREVSIRSRYVGGCGDKNRNFNRLELSFPPALNLRRAGSKAPDRPLVITRGLKVKKKRDVNRGHAPPRNNGKKKERDS